MEPPVVGPDCLFGAAAGPAVLNALQLREHLSAALQQVEQLLVAARDRSRIVADFVRQLGEALLERLPGFICHWDPLNCRPRIAVRKYARCLRPWGRGGEAEAACARRATCPTRSPGLFSAKRSPRGAARGNCG